MFPLIALVGLGVLAVSTVWKVANWMRPIPLNCPTCGQPMQPVKSQAQSGDNALTVYRCSTHGLIHVGPKTDLTPGPPPR